MTMTNAKPTKQKKKKQTKNKNNNSDDDDDDDDDDKKKMKVKVTRTAPLTKNPNKKKSKRKNENEITLIIILIRPKKKESADPEWDKVFPMDETKDSEPLALTNSNEVEQIAMKGNLKVKKAIECIQVHSRLAVFKDDFRYKDQVDSDAKTYCLNIQQAAVEIFKTYGTMGTNFLIAQTIVQWKPQKVESVEAKVFWEGVVCACNEVVTQLMNTIRLGAEFQQALAGVRAGIVDFVDRCLYGEDVPFAIQGLDTQLDKFKEYQDKVGLFADKTGKEVENSIRQAFTNGGGSKEAEEISKQLLSILEKLKNAEEKKKEFRKKEEETSKKIEEIMKSVGEKQADKCSCEIELSIAKNDVASSQAAKDWSQKRKQELNQEASKATDWCTVTKYRTCYTYRWYWWSYSWPYQESYQEPTKTGEQTKLLEMEDKMKKETEEFEAKREKAVKKQQENNTKIIKLNNEIDTLEKQKNDLIKETNEEMKKIEKEIDDIIIEKDKLQDNLSKILKETGLRSADAVKEFFQVYDKFQQGLVLSYAGLVNISRDIKILGNWFSLKFNTEIKLETLLRSSNLGALIQPLQTIGVNKAIHLCRRRGGNFNKDIRSRLQAIDGINSFDIDALEDFCETLTIDYIKEKQKNKEQSTKMMVAVMSRPMCVKSQLKNNTYYTLLFYTCFFHIKYNSSFIFTFLQITISIPYFFLIHKTITKKTTQ
ncbi:virulent strain associated lipoprotein [Reticulomyxa filosa]|uniref:Virulent strain associated lipoprotein n=1 Tax=Reticulomyxa filosa TaxID=46433 RepID=X6MCH0_RETFI|nr:virulent strain associated lipoprotein [Reticulomyxa filosa]|eukprot:ETO11564.1 virulent strain associated lipoprotein [Reticulomyxa filosa]